MDIETIVKLLKSDNEADYRIGYELALAKWYHHWKINENIKKYNMRIGYGWSNLEIRIFIYKTWGDNYRVKTINKYVSKIKK